MIEFVIESKILGENTSAATIKEKIEIGDKHMCVFHVMFLVIDRYVQGMKVVL